MTPGSLGVDSKFDNNKGLPFIPVGSNQDVTVYDIAEQDEHPDDVGALVGTSPVGMGPDSGNQPIFWYVGSGHHSSDTFLAQLLTASESGLPANSFPPGTTILIVDQTNGVVLSLTVSWDGSVSGQMRATIDDVRAVTITAPDKTTVSFTRSKFVTPDGRRLHRSNTS